MSEFGERGRRPGARPATGRPSTERTSNERLARGAPRQGRPDADLSASPRAARPDRSGYQGKSPRDEPEDRDPLGLRSVRNRHDDPVIPDDVQAKELDRVARAQLKTLSKENADEVARHLVMVARLIESDPALAHLHAVSAARRAGRIGVVRETLAITAYSTADFALALRELRTFRRISGNDDQLPLMVDSERGLGRADRALELGRSVPRASLAVEVQVLLAIAMSGARLDLGQTEAALTELQIAQLNPSTAYSWSPVLFDAYATVLEELGREDEAEEWWQRSDRASEALDGALSGEEDTIDVVEEDEEADAVSRDEQASNDGQADD